MKAKPRGKPKAKASTADFYWFQGASVRELANRLQLAGPDTARLEVRLSGDKMTFRVVPHADSQALQAPADINESRVCPPICPH